MPRPLASLSPDTSVPCARVVAAMLALPLHPRRRIRGKTPPPVGPAAAAAAVALHAEVASARPELLAPGIKRKHMHYTLVRTHGDHYQQPAAFTRKGFFDLLLAA